MSEAMACESEIMQITDDVIAAISEHVKPKDLPGDLAEAADFIGVEKALKLALHVHGSPYLSNWSNDPEKWTVHVQAIVDTIGIEDAQIIITNFRNTHFVIPKCDAFWRKWTYRIVAENKDEDRSILARKLGVSERWIYHILRKLKNNENQLGLF